MSASINDIFFGTSVAAVHGSGTLRLYEVDVFGGIREARHDGKWIGGTPSDVVATGKIGTPTAAIKLQSDSIRVYYVGTDNNLKEAAYDDGKGWSDGALSRGNFSVAPYSGISAVFFGGWRILLYGQLPDDTIQEWYWDSNREWTVGTNYGAALPGTSIAATTWGASSPYHIRLYFQDSKLSVVEKAWDGGDWYDGDLHFTNKLPRAPLGVASCGEGISFDIRLYYGAPDNTIKEKVWDGSGSWYDGGFSQVSVPGSKVAVLPLPVGRVYMQKGTLGTAITEFAWNDKWVVGEEALPPA